MVVEGTPLRIRGETESKEAREPKAAGKPVVLGALAVEAAPKQSSGGAENEPQKVEIRMPNIKNGFEHLAHMLLSTEESEKPETAGASTDRSAKQEKDLLVESPMEPSTGKRVDTMSREELLQLGERIEIDGNSLRKIFETHLIGERGLRRLVAEHLRGGNLRKALKREVLEREIDFERDPAMRDIAPVTLPAGGSIPVLDNLLEKADVEVADSSEQAAFFKARARYRAQTGQKHHQSRHRLADVVLMALIAILTILVIVLYFTRH